VTTRQVTSCGGGPVVVSRSVAGTAGAVMEASMAVFCADRSLFRSNCQGESSRKHAAAKANAARMIAIHPGRSR